MSLQKKLDLIEQYGTGLRFLPHPGRGIDYTVAPITRIEGTTFNIEVYHEAKITERERG